MFVQAIKRFWKEYLVQLKDLGLEQYLTYTFLARILCAAMLYLIERIYYGFWSFSFEELKC